MADSRPLFIADASVIVKWAVNELEDLKQALAFKNDFINKVITVIVPTFCFPEVCNALYLKNPKNALRFLADLFLFNITEYHITFGLANISFQFMKQYRGISFYDALYHALAIEQKGTFITADEKYYRKTKKEGHIMLLKDYGKKR